MPANDADRSRRREEIRKKNRPHSSRMVRPEEIDWLLDQLEAAERDRERLRKAALEFLAIHPVFRGKPVGGEGSQARREQEDAIRAENELRDASKESR